MSNWLSSQCPWELKNKSRLHLLFRLPLFQGDGNGHHKQRLRNWENSKFWLQQLTFSQNKILKIFCNVFQTCMSRFVTKPFSSLSHMAKRCWALILKSATSSAILGFPWWRFRNPQIFHWKINAREEIDCVQLLNKSADNWNVQPHISLVLSYRNRCNPIMYTRSCYNSCRKWYLLSFFITGCLLLYYVITLHYHVCVENSSTVRDALVSTLKPGCYPLRIPEHCVHD